MTMLLIGFIFGGVFGFSLAVAAWKVEVRRDRNRRPGYVNERRRP